ncbi:MAG TPA: hypothetical protein VHL11_15620, partial [Phototrophicaceae bacterium]|nr:hypothetical protein [Phototrophicaceae bacterium]
LGYELVAFDSAEDAAAALADGFLDTLAKAEGYIRTDTTLLGASVYARQSQLCNTTATEGRIYVQRGRFITAIASAIPADRSYSVDAVMDQFAARVYELALASILRREIR